MFMDDKTVKKLQRTGIGAQYPVHPPESLTFPSQRTPKKTSDFPDVGETTKSDPVPEEMLVRCPRCGMEEAGWTGERGKGVKKGAEVYCCRGCAENIGCDCVAESERHTGLNMAQGETDAAPPKPI